MSDWGWVAIGLGVAVFAVVMTFVACLAALVLPEWDPDRDGFSNEEDE
jgi:hypothetical protein